MTDAGQFQAAAAAISTARGRSLERLRRYFEQGGWWDASIALLSLIFIAALWLVNIERVAYERQETEENVAKQNANLALAMEEHTIRTLKSVDQALAQIAREYREEGAKLDIAQFIREGAIDDRLFHNISVIDENGHLVLAQISGKVDARDRDFFWIHQNEVSGQMYIGRPLLGRVTGQWFIPMSRRLNKPDGSFAGVVLASVDPDYFTAFYAQADLGRYGLVNLVGLDGITRARRMGDKSSFGQDRGTKSTLAAKQAKAPQGSFLSRGVQEGVPRFQSYRTLKDYPLIVAVGTSQAESLSGFYARRRVYYLWSALATVFIALFAALQIAALVRQRRTQEEVALKNTVLSTQQEVSQDAILVVDEDTKIVSYNRKFIDMWRIPEEMVRAGNDKPVLQTVVGQIRGPEEFLARIEHLYAHREEKSNEEIQTNDGRTIDRYSAPVAGADGRYHGRIWYFRNVTERVRREADLRASEQRFRQLAQTIGDVFWMAPPDLKSIQYISPAFEKVWGVPCADLYANPGIWLEAVHAEDVSSVASALEGLSRGEHYDIQFRIHRPDGTQRWINDRGYAMKDEAGRVILTTGVASDVTERRNAEAAIHIQQLQRQAILDSIPDMAWLKDTESRFLAVNDALARMFGQPAAALLGKSDADFVPADIAARYRNDDMEVIRDGGHRCVEETIEGADGSRRVIETIKTRVCDPEGAIIGTAGIARDITERRKSEEQLRLSAKAFDSIADGIIVTDPDQRIVSVNSAFTSITGYTREELIGRTPRSLQSGRHAAAFYAEMWRELKATGSWKGEIWDKRKNGDIYPELLSISAVKDAAGAVAHYVGVCTDISSLKRYEAELHHQAHHDALTGLPNRTLFRDRFHETLARAQRHGHLAAVLFLDLDHFKNINDSLGHAVGDLLLQAVGKRLTSAVREIDTVARFGGDEFAVLLDIIGDSQGAATVAQKLLDALALPFDLEGHAFFISVSIGISCYPQDGGDIETLFKNADTAMYRAKTEGRNNYQFFSAEMNARALENLQMSNHLRLALEHDELLLHYQPCIDLKSGRVSSAEALVRWNHPEFGMLAPTRFIPIAEETGLIEPIGEWVLKTACRQMRAWQDTGLPLDRIAVNLSARQFRHPDLARRIAAILEETRLPAHHLELEVTESMVMQNPDGAADVLSQLKAMGITIAIDDFGTGYSSLSYLKRFPIDFLKIDRSFVSGVQDGADDAAITRAIIALARSLNLKLIAEGVETAEQRDFLKANGCDEAQGYLFSRPVPAAEIPAIVGVTQGLPVAVPA